MQSIGYSSLRCARLGHGGCRSVLRPCYTAQDRVKTLKNHLSTCSLRTHRQSIRTSVKPPVRYASTATKLAEQPPLETIVSDLTVSTPIPKPVTLRPYQEDAITACLEALDSGLTRLGVSSPTGSGKTTMFMKIIPEIVERIPGRRGRTLILVNGVDLANQAENAARRILGDEWSVEVEQADRIASGRADVTIATFQTLLNEQRIRKFDPTKYDLVIVDEAHHAAAKSYLRILHYFHDEVQLPKSVLPINGSDHEHKTPIIGFSATFSRQDQLSLAAVFEKIVFHRDVTHMLRDGWLSPAKCTTVKADLQLGTVEIAATGDFVTNSLASHIDTAEINELVVRTYLYLAEERRSTLVFCVSLDHVANMVTAFREAGIDARAVSSLSKASHRKKTLQDFMQGEFPVLVNCEVLTEGTDIPVIDCIILARPTKSRNLLAQMIGRGLRLSPDTGKKDCHIIDLADSTSKGLLVSPTLLGLTHDDIEEQELRNAEERAANAESALAPPSKSKEEDDFKVTFIDEEDPFGLERKENPRRVTQLTYNAWVACGKGRYILELMMSSGYIQIEPAKSSKEAGAWVISYHWKVPMGTYGSSLKLYNHNMTVAHAQELERAFQTADQYALNKVGRERSLLLARNSLWRRRPASPKAQNLLLKMKGVVLASNSDGSGNSAQGTISVMGKEVDVRKLTAGEIAAYVSAAKHGAASRRKDQDAKEAARMIKLEKKAAKERMKAEELPLPLSGCVKWTERGARERSVKR